MTDSSKSRPSFNMHVGIHRLTLIHPIAANVKNKKVFLSFYLLPDCKTELKGFDEENYNVRFFLLLVMCFLEPTTVDENVCTL